MFLIQVEGNYSVPRKTADRRETENGRPAN